MQIETDANQDLGAKSDKESLGMDLLTGFWVSCIRSNSTVPCLNKAYQGRLIMLQ